MLLTVLVVHYSYFMGRIAADFSGRKQQDFFLYNQKLNKLLKA